ncbi:Crp/Fnr family transcriptional regulator [candidate division KSB1 bacterium]|nr:Crp/Fnr family transcriptional regulator [candidate division KSB1 bacterium]
MNNSIDLQDALSRLFLFETLAPEQLTHIERLTSIKQLCSGDMLFADGQVATAFFAVISGAVKIFKLSADGNEQIIHIQKPGDLIAEAVIFDMEKFPAHCQAVQDTTLLRISKQEFRSFLEHFPDVCFRIMSAYSRRIRQLLNKIEELSLHDIKSRLANYILTNGQEWNGQFVCMLSTTKKNLAALLGTIPETLSRTLHTFKKDGLIEEKGRYLIILDRNGLKNTTGV